MRARVAASLATASLLAVGVAGCNFVTPQATTKHYDPSDGISAVFGDVKVINVLAITDEDHQDANLVFTAVNRSGDDVTLNVQYDSDGTATTETVKLDSGANDIGHGTDGQLLLSGTDTLAGSLLPVYFQYGDEPGKRLMVPVLDGSWADYEHLVPTPTPEITLPVEPSNGPTPLPTETPAP